MGWSGNFAIKNVDRISDDTAGSPYILRIAMAENNFRGTSISEEMVMLFKKLSIVIMLILGIGILGCLPKRVTWSPDGQRGVFVSEANFYMIDHDHPDQPLPVAKDISRVAWLSDSKHFVAVCATPIRKWEDLKTQLSVSDRDELVAKAEKLNEDMKEYKGKWDDFRSSQGITDGELVAAMIYLRDVRGEQLQKVIDKKRWAEIQKLETRLIRLQLYEVKDNQAVAGEILLTALDDIIHISASPKGNYIAYVTQLSDYRFKSIALYVVSIDGKSQPQLVAKGVSQYPCWSPDGQYLIFGQTTLPGMAEENAISIGKINRIRVCGKNGKLLKTFDKPEELLAVLFWDRIKIYCLPDNKILFSGNELSMPCKMGDAAIRPTLFSYNLQDKQLKPLLTKETHARFADGISLGLFELSPDGKHIMLANAGNDVYIYSLESGDIVEVMAENKNQDRLLLSPTWRNADEICLGVYKGTDWGTPDRNEVALWSLSKKKGRCISRKWPEEIIDGLLFKPQSKDQAGSTQPASQ